MSSMYFSGEGVSPAPGVTYGLTDVERRAWALFDAYAANGKALWIDAGSRYALNSGPGDAPSGFELLDRCADRRFRPEPVRNRHPYLVAASGRPMLMFGAGGTAPNALDTNFNGTLYPPSILASDGVTETNQRPMLLPGQGWTVAFRFAMATPGSALNGVTYATAGGSLLGGGVTGTDSSAGLSIGFDNNSGYLQALNQRGVQTGGQFLQVGTDHRTGATYSYVVTWDVAAGTMRAWRDRTLVATQTSVTTDISTAAGCSVPMIGGVGQLTSGPAARFFGGMSFLSFLPGAVGNDDAIRSTLFDLMAAR